MRIIVDAFGGDHAPLEIIKGSAQAHREYGVSILLVGDGERIRAVAGEHEIPLDGMEIVDCKPVMSVEEDPRSILREQSDSTMAVGLKLLGDGNGDAFVSAGSTGALVVGGTFLVKRMKGVKRAALAPVMPSATGSYMLLDAGANADCRPDALRQFAVMGSSYMEHVMGVVAPRVGLVNIGTEETKGRELELGAYALLQKTPVNFIGNVEARSIPLGDCDVVVTDGFTGNILLKLTEGMGKFFSNSLRDIFHGVAGKAAGALVYSRIKTFKKRMDYKEAGGAPLMGLAKPVIKAHGSSDAKAFMNAIRQAKDFAEKDVIGKISQTLAGLQAAEEGDNA